MNLHRRGLVAACVAMTFLTLCSAGIADAFAQKRAGNRARVQADLRKKPPQPSAGDDDRASTYLDEGQRHADRGDWVAALKSYKQATAINPRHAEAHIYVGDAYMSSGKYEEAIAAYKEALRVAPSNAEAHYSLGAAYNDMAMYGDAFRPFVQAIRFDPNHAEAHHGIGYAYLKQENFKDAIVYLKRAVNIRNGYPEAHLSLGLAYLGLGQMKLVDEQLKVLQGRDGLLAKELEKEMQRVGVAAVRPQPDAQNNTDTAVRDVEVRPQRGNREPGVETQTQTTSQIPRIRTKKAEGDRTQKTEGDAPTPQQRPSQVASAEPQPEGSASQLSAELNIWDRIKNSADPEDYEAYLRKYPAGEFAGLARIRLRILEANRGEAGKPGKKQKQETAAAQPTTADAVTTVAEPAPRPRAGARLAPTIEETLRLLKKDFANKLTYTTTAPGEDANVVKVTSEVVVEYEPLQFDNCRIEWRDRKDTVSIALSDLDPLGVKVEARSKLNTTFSIAVWNLTLTTADGEPTIRAIKGDGSGAVNNYNGLKLQFDNKEKAERLARLLQQAIKLCGSGQMNQ